MTAGGGTGGPVLIISLDAFELEMLRAGVDEGWLPNLAQLIADGTSVQLVADDSDIWALVPGSVWPSTISGRLPQDHLLNFDRQLRPGSYRIEDATSAALRHPPFWRTVSDIGLRSTIVSVYGAPRLDDFLGTQVLGWGTSDPYNAKLSGPWIDPPEVRGWLDGVAPGRRSGFLATHPGSLQEMMGYLDAIVASVEEQTRALTMLMERTTWDLFFGNFFEAHEAGHVLWHFCDPDSPDHDPAAPAELRDGIRRIYVALDTAVGTLLARRPDGATVFVLTPHGMGPANHVYYSAGRLLTAGRWTVPQTTPPPREQRWRWWVARGRRAAHRITPLRWRQAASRLVPAGHARLLAATRLAEVDWSVTTAFALPHDASSLVRLNLAGREPSGTVAPGAGYERVCREIGDAARALVDEATGNPVVRAVVRVDEVIGAPVGDVLPDLVITWHAQRGEWLTGPVGRLSTATDDRRTGEHVAHGFLLGVGPGIAAGGGPALSAQASILDVAPTVLRRLGVALPPDLAGTPIASLAGGGSI